MNKRLYVDFHILQTVPPSCINRDDTGSPKTAVYGGVTRARVSSQAWKHAMRAAFAENARLDVGKRTKKAAELVKEQILVLDPEQKKADKMAKEALKYVGIKSDDKKGTDALIFISSAQAKALAELVVGGCTKDEEYEEALIENPSADMVLFGRMVAQKASLKYDAAAQVAHSISTHAVQNEYDYFTAVDDCQVEDNAGAGHLGTVEYNSSTLYRYATVNVMELPAYHWPTAGNVLRSTWERGWSFIKKAGTIILLSTIFVWFTTYFGTVDGTFRMLSEDEINYSILASIGGAIAWIFKPLGWGNWQAVVASITGLIAKENIVGTLGILYGGGDGSVYSNLASAFTPITAYSFLVFNLLCAPCFAAIGAIKREMNNAGWTWFAIGYQCGFAYVIALMINQFGNLFTGNANLLGVVAAAAFLAGMVYMLFKPYKEAAKLSAKP